MVIAPIILHLLFFMLIFFSWVKKAKIYMISPLLRILFYLDASFIEKSRDFL